MRLSVSPARGSAPLSPLLPNIAADQARRRRKEFLHFLTVARGSAAELSTGLEIAKRLGVRNARGSHPTADSMHRDYQTDLSVAECAHANL
ncbi:MAG: four helix bundle protein [Terriglobales bacterium]